MTGVIMSKYQGGKVGSLSRLREQLKKGGGGTFIKNVPANDVMVVRFLTEPEEWYQYDEAYDPEVRRYFPLLEGMERTPDMRVSKRFLACVLDVTDDKVIPLKMPKDLANRVLMRYDRYDTVMDRDYELSRMGEGLDTTYDCAPGDKVARNLKKYTLLDLDDVIAKAADYAGVSSSTVKDDPPVSKKAVAKRIEASLDDDEDDDEVEAPVAPAKPAAKRAPKRVDPVVVEDDEDDDEDEDETPAPAKKAAPSAPAKSTASDDDDDSFPEDEDDDEEDGDDDVAAAVTSDDDDDSYSEAELQAMSLRDLRALADAYGIDHTGLNKAGLIEAIMYE